MKPEPGSAFIIDFRLVLFCLVMSTLLFGCMIPEKARQLTINGIVFQNHTTQTVHNVTVSVETTSMFANCSHVYADGECSNMFPFAPYRGNPIRITWEQEGKVWSTEELYLSTSETIIPGQPAKAYIVITGAGRARAELVQR